MRLVELIAEYYYLKDTNNAPVVPFKEQDSNIRDFYFEFAHNTIPQLIHSYLSQGTWLGKLVRGSIRDFINSHGTLLDKNNFNSLAKRITRNIWCLSLERTPDPFIRAYLKSPSYLHYTLGTLLKNFYDTKCQILRLSLIASSKYHLSEEAR